MPNLISVVINTKNSADTLATCIDSVSWADEVIVVDMHSTDATQSIAKDKNVPVFLCKSLDYVEPARQYALSLAKHTWVLMLDADELIPTSLAKKIRQLLADTDPDVAGYYIPRKNIIFKSWVKAAGWWPDYQLRLFQSKCVKWQTQIHSQPQIISGNIIELPAQEQLAIEHLNYKTLDDYLLKQQRYTKLEAQQRPTNTNVDAKTMIAAFGNEFLSRMFAQKGYQANNHGLALSLLQANYELLVTLRQWETQGFLQDEQGQAQIVSELWQFDKNMRWWLLNYQIDHSKGLKKLFFKVMRLFI